ncbi:MAG: hypothetical protein R2744_03195 [Bacteroidales bacterium]
MPTITFRTADTKGYDFNYGEIWHTERDLYNMSIPEYQEHTSIVTAIVCSVCDTWKAICRAG